MGEMRKYAIWLEDLKGRDHTEDLGVDGRIILESSICRGKADGA
jgi:hypothetical protein